MIEENKMDTQKCKVCQSEWKSSVKSSKCPFCGADCVEPDVKFGSDIAGALSKIIFERGIDVLTQPKIVASLVTDYVQGYEREKKLLRIAIQNDALSFLHTVYHTNDDEQKKVLSQKMIKKLEDDAFFSKENSQYIVLLILKSIGFEMKAQNEPTPAKKSEPSQERNKTVNNSKIAPQKQSKAPNTNRQPSKTSNVQSNDSDVEYKVLTKEIFPSLLTRVVKEDYGTRKLLLPNSYNKIGDRALEGVKEVDMLIIPKGYIAIGENAFSWAIIHQIVIPDSVTVIAKNAFKGFTGVIGCSEIHMHISLLKDMGYVR